jgi:prepilin-type N-terminal cleavage/methylation domain-containing protein
MRQPRKALTLLEVVLVMVLFVVLAGISYPTLDSMIGSFRVTAAADAVKAAWAQARAHAINEGVAYRFCVLPGKGNYRLAPDSGDNWAGNGAPATPPDPANLPLILEEILPKGVRCTTRDGGSDDGGNSASSLSPGSVDPNAWRTIAVFLPDGTAREDAEMVLRHRGTRPIVVNIRGLTGIATSRPL